MSIKFSQECPLYCPYFMRKNCTSEEPLGMLKLEYTCKAYNLFASCSDIAMETFQVPDCDKKRGDEE